MEVAAHLLLAFVGPDRFPGDPLIIMSHDGEVAVVEQVVCPPGRADRTTVTSVVRMRAGLVAEGRTYADVAAWPDDAAASAAHGTVR